MKPAYVAICVVDFIVNHKKYGFATCNLMSKISSISVVKDAWSFIFYLMSLMLGYAEELVLIKCRYEMVNMLTKFNSFMV